MVQADVCLKEFMSKPIRILVTDDNEVNQQVLLGMLKHAGYSVDLANDGREAINRLSETRYDLLILDCMMPIMDGFETARAIRNSGSGSFDPKIPILAITALATKEDRDKCLDSGMNDFIAKPVNARSLYSRLERLLEETQAGPANSLQASDESDVPELTGKQTQQNNSPVDLGQIVRSMSASIIRDSELWISALPRLQAAGEFQQLSELAHKIRGTADVLNDLQISVLARSLEDSSKVKDELITGSLTISLISELRRLGSELESESPSSSR
jgi:CheY-like chemotaxis protein/HPt (histidine-containing phosphotransfer) domain-containing protein